MSQIVQRLQLQRYHFLYGCVNFIAFILVRRQPFFYHYKLYTRYLCCSEFYFPYAQKWLEIRGVIMILVMKALSLSHDFDNSRHLPPLFEFLGYTCCPANCMFGPWISFAEYCSVFRKPHKKVRNKIGFCRFKTFVCCNFRIFGGL